MATLLLLLFVLAVALPLLPPRLLDPFWQQALASSLCTWGPLALLAVWLMNLAAVLDPRSLPLQQRQQRLARLCRWVVFAFLLLIPLQGLISLRSLESAQIGERRGARLQLLRIEHLRQAVVRADSIAALQANLAAIQAPPLNAQDQRRSLQALRTNLLGQLQAAEQELRQGGADSAAPMARRQRSLTPLLKEAVRVVLLCLGLAFAFAAAAQRLGSPLTQLGEWQLALQTIRISLRDRVAHWQQGSEERQRRRQERARWRRQSNRTTAAPPAKGVQAGVSRLIGRPSPDAAYFEALADAQADPSAAPTSPGPAAPDAPP